MPCVMNFDLIIYIIINSNYKIGFDPLRTSKKQKNNEVVNLGREEGLLAYCYLHMDIFAQYFSLRLVLSRKNKNY